MLCTVEVALLRMNMNEVKSHATVIEDQQISGLAHSESSFMSQWPVTSDLVAACADYAD